MDNTETLVKMMNSRITCLNRESSKLARMATFATCPRERRNLREESKSLKNRAKMMQARLDKLQDLVPVRKDVING